MDPRHGRQCRDGADKRKQSRNAGLINEFGASCEPFNRSMGYQMKFHEGPLHLAIFRLSFDPEKRLPLGSVAVNTIIYSSQLIARRVTG